MVELANLCSQLLRLQPALTHSPPSFSLPPSPSLYPPSLLSLNRQLLILLLKKVLLNVPALPIHPCHSLLLSLPPRAQEASSSTRTRGEIRSELNWRTHIHYHQALPHRNYSPLTDFGVPPTEPLDSSAVKDRPHRPLGSVRPPSRSTLHQVRALTIHTHLLVTLCVCYRMRLKGWQKREEGEKLHGRGSSRVGRRRSQSSRLLPSLLLQ